MLELTIITAICLGEVAFMVVFFVALCRDGRSGERCHVVRIDPERSAAGELTGTTVHPFVAHGAVRRWALHHSETPNRTLKLVEMSRRTETSSLLKKHNRH